jgi:hypothetical protein
LQRRPDLVPQLLRNAAYDHLLLLSFPPRPSSSLGEEGTVFGYD